MKRLGTLLVFAIFAILVSTRVFAETVPAQAATPEPAKVAFLQSLEVDPVAPAALPGFFTGQPAPTPRTCLGNCYTAYTACKATCNGNTTCFGNCFDAYDGCRCSCGSCR